MNNQDCKPDTESEFQEWRAGEIQSRAVLGASIDVWEGVAAKCIGGARKEAKKKDEAEAEEKERREVGHHGVCGVSSIPPADLVTCYQGWILLSPWWSLLLFFRLDQIMLYSGNLKRSWLYFAMLDILDLEPNAEKYV